MNTNLLITSKDGKNHVMSVNTYAKWLCLIEAMEFINNSKFSKQKDLDKESFWIQPVEFRKYLKARYPSMLHDLKVEEYLDF
jgi:hypothetical protein